MAYVEDRWIRRTDRKRTERYGKGLRWRVNWEEAGSIRRKSFGSKDAAQAYLDELRGDIAKGIYRPASAGKISVADYSEVWMSQQVHQRASSMDVIRLRMRRNIIPTLGSKSLKDLTRTDIQDAIAEWSETLAPATAKLTYKYLSGMLKAAVLDDHLASTPCVGIKLPPVEVEPVIPLPGAMVQAIHDEIWSPYRMMVVLCAATGMRQGEARGLTWDRVDLGGGIIRVERQQLAINGLQPVWGPLKTKGSTRTIRVGPETVAALKEHRKLGEGPSGSVLFSGPRVITRGAAAEAWRNVRITLPDIGDGWHQIRHFHASLLIAAGRSVVAVAHRLGHKDAHETLSTYAHLWPDDDELSAAASDGVVNTPPPVHPPDDAQLLVSAG